MTTHDETTSVDRGLKPVFIHINKTAGTSIVRSGGDRIVNAGHRTAASWRDEHGGAHRLFSVVRHPYERVRSEYTYRRRRWEGGEQNPHLVNLHLSFDDWVEATYAGDEYRTLDFFERTGIFYHESQMIDGVLIWFRSQLRWLSNASGRVIVDDLLRFERLDDDWRSFATRNGISGGLVHVNASPTGPAVAERFTDRVREIVHAYYRDDFEMFGYER